jgi:phosphate transport system permease protein
MESVFTTAPLIPSKKRSVVSKQGIEQLIKAYFGGNALVAVIVLALITVFLIREGSGFFGQNLSNLRLYRSAGLEYVDIIRATADQHASLSRGLNDLRLRQFRLGQLAGTPLEEINAALAPYDEFATAFSDSSTDINGLVSDLGEQATALKEQLFARAELIGQRDALARQGRDAEAAAIVIPGVDRATAMTVLATGTPGFDAAATAMTAQVHQLLVSAPSLPDASVQQGFEKWKQRVRDYLGGLPMTQTRLREWSADAPVPWYRSISSFLFGADWITASFWQDWYGIRPLLVGSILVSVVALFFAVPLGVASAFT